MVNYKNAKVYKLVSNVPGDDNMYIGSTCQSLAMRMTMHRSAARSGKMSKQNVWMRDVGVENVSIILIEKTPCDSFDEQRMHERRWSDILNPSLNMIRPYITRKEVAERKKEYTEKKLDEVTEYQKQYRQQNQEQLALYKKRYREKNKETMSEYQREYQRRNREKINARNRAWRALKKQQQTKNLTDTQDNEQ